MSYEAIGLAIYNLLGTITEIDEVYNYEPNELVKYPCATVTALDHTNSFANTAQNRREFRFMVRIYFRRDQSDYENIMRKVVDELIVSVEGEPTLSGTCDFAIPTESKWLYQEKEVPVRLCEITINAVKLLNR